MVGAFVVEEETGDDGEVTMLGALEEDMKVVEEETGDDGEVALFGTTQVKTTPESHMRALELEPDPDRTS